MTDIRVHGGRKLADGVFRVQGSRHLLMVCVAIAISGRAYMKLENVPSCADTRHLLQILSILKIPTRTAQGVWIVDARGMEFGDVHLPKRLTTRFRGSIYLFPALAAVAKSVTFGGSGGCQLASTENGRPTSQVRDVMERFGCVFSNDGQTATLDPTAAQKDVDIDIQTYSTNPHLSQGGRLSSATKTALIFAAARQGRRTTIRNPLRIHTISDHIVRLMAEMGLDVDIQRTAWRFRREEIRPVLSFEIFPDVSEVITLITLGIMTDTRITVKGITVPELQRAIPDDYFLMGDMNIELSPLVDGFSVEHGQAIQTAFIQSTSEGVVTDNQPFYALLLTCGRDTGFVQDNVFPERHQYARELRKMAANVEIENNVVAIRPSKIFPPSEELFAGDLRAAAVLLIAALSAQGITTIRSVGHLERGYNGLIASLNDMGAAIEVLEEKTLIAS